jgi:cation-transporting ATPase 13A1
MLEEREISKAASRNSPKPLQVSVFVVNLKGRPFMGGLMDNKPLLYSLMATFALVFMCASETIPRLNKWLQLEPFPDDGFRTTLLSVLALDICAALAWDRLMLLLFAPSILWASFEGVTMQDVVKLGKILMICGAIIYLLATSEDPGNFPLGGACLPGLEQSKGLTLSSTRR